MDNQASVLDNSAERGDDAPPLNLILTAQTQISSGNYPGLTITAKELGTSVAVHPIMASALLLIATDFANQGYLDQSVYALKDAGPHVKPDSPELSQAVGAVLRLAETGDFGNEPRLDAICAAAFFAKEEPTSEKYAARSHAERLWIQYAPPAIDPESKPEPRAIVAHLSLMERAALPGSAIESVAVTRWQKTFDLLPTEDPGLQHFPSRVYETIEALPNIQRIEIAQSAALAHPGGKLETAATNAWRREIISVPMTRQQRASLAATALNDAQPGTTFHGVATEIHTRNYDPPAIAPSDPPPAAPILPAPTILQNFTSFMQGRLSSSPL